jgi:hypothetical protein
MNESCVGLHGIAVDPHSLMPNPAVVKATFPLPAAIFKLGVTTSGITGNGMPTVPTVPTWTR